MKPISFDWKLNSVLKIGITSSIRITLPKIATKNRQNRQMAEFSQSELTKVVEGQILCEKLVS